MDCVATEQEIWIQARAESVYVNFILLNSSNKTRIVKNSNTFITAFLNIYRTVLVFRRISIYRSNHAFFSVQSITTAIWLLWGLCCVIINIISIFHWYSTSSFIISHYAKRSMFPMQIFLKTSNTRLLLHLWIWYHLKKYHLMPLLLEAIDQVSISLIEIYIVSVPAATIGKTSDLEDQNFWWFTTII